jgi:hypothetical protein
MKMPKEESRDSHLATDERGHATIEYVLVTAVLGLVVAATMVARGDALLFDYANAHDLLLLAGM